MGIIWGIRIHFTECTIISISLLACYTLVNIAGYLIGKKYKKNKGITDYYPYLCRNK